MDAVEVRGGGDVTYIMQLFLDRSHVIRRWVTHTGTERVKLVYDATLRNVRLDAPLAPASFAYAPPKTAKPIQMPDEAAHLLAVGAPAPDFTLSTPDQGSVDLASRLRQAKAVLINFWFYG